MIECNFLLFPPYNKHQLKIERKNFFSPKIIKKEFMKKNIQFQLENLPVKLRYETMMFFQSDHYFFYN